MTKLEHQSQSLGNQTTSAWRKQLLSLPPDLDSLPSWQLQHERPAKPHVGQDMQIRKNKGVIDCWLPEPWSVYSNKNLFQDKAIQPLTTALEGHHQFTLVTKNSWTFLKSQGTKGVFQRQEARKGPIYRSASVVKEMNKDPT